MDLRRKQGCAIFLYGLDGVDCCGQIGLKPLIAGLTVGLYLTDTGRGKYRVDVRIPKAFRVRAEGSRLEPNGKLCMMQGVLNSGSCRVLLYSCAGGLIQSIAVGDEHGRIVGS